VPTRWIAAAALVLAACRFAGLGRYGLWIDEAFTIHDAQALELTRLTKFPLGLAMMKPWLAFVGSPVDEATLRLPAAVLGALSIPLTAWAFRPLLGARQGWIAAFVLACSSFHMYWSQSARAYTLVLVLSLVGAGWALRGCVHARPALYFAGLAVASCAAAAHPTGALVPAALWIAPGLARAAGAPLAWAPRAWIVWAAGIAGALALSPWLRGVWRDYYLRKSGSSAAHFALSTGFYVTAPVALACVVTAWSVLRNRARPQTLVVLVALIGTGATFAASQLVRASAQYVFVLAPWFAAAAAWALDEEAAPRRLARALGLVLLAWACFDLGAYATVRHGDRPRWRDAYRYVARTRGAEDLVFGMAAPAGGYYLAPREEHLRASTALVPLTPYAWDELRYGIAQERRMWIVLNREDLEDWPALERRRFERFLREQCELRRTFTVGGTPRPLDVEVHLRP
jgi:hypothetical protein